MMKFGEDVGEERVSGCDGPGSKYVFGSPKIGVTRSD